MRVESIDKRVAFSDFGCRIFRTGYLDLTEIFVPLNAMKLLLWNYFLHPCNSFVILVISGFQSFRPLKSSQLYFIPLTSSQQNFRPPKSNQQFQTPQGGSKIYGLGRRSFSAPKNCLSLQFFMRKKTFSSFSFVQKIVCPVIFLVEISMPFDLN